jgi:hypothetical protein
MEHSPACVFQFHFHTRRILQSPLPEGKLKAAFRNKKESLTAKKIV